MTFLLDTSAISALVRRDPRITGWIASLDSDSRLVTCTIVRGELLFGLPVWTPDDAARTCKTKPTGSSNHSPASLFRPRLRNTMPQSRLPGNAACFPSMRMTSASPRLPLALNASLVSRDGDFQRIASLNVLSP